MKLAIRKHTRKIGFRRQSLLFIQKQNAFKLSVNTQTILNSKFIILKAPEAFNRYILRKELLTKFILCVYFPAALADLEEALKLSKSSGRTGCKALCQRGLLRRKHNNDDAAKEDFSNAAKLGSKFARSQV